MREQVERTGANRSSRFRGRIRSSCWTACVALCGSAALLATALGCSRQTDTDFGPTARVEQGRIERLIVATGTIEPEEEVEVRSRISGIVERVHVAAGDQVVAGQPLVDIERELLEAHVAQARAQLESSRVEQTLARSELQRAVALHRQKTIAEQDQEEAQARHDAAVAAVARDQASLNALLIELGYTTVIAPIAGRILDVDAKKGSAVASVASVTGGTRLLTIAADQQLHVKGLVDENELNWVQLGQPARVRTEAYPGRHFVGEVRKIKPLGNRQQNVTYFEIEVLVTDPQAAQLRTRMSADADIVTEVVDDALIVPEAALLYDGDRVFVNKVISASPKHLEEQTVRVGIVEKGRAQILSGLAANDEVAVK